MKGNTMLNDKQKVFVDILKKEYPDAVEVRRGDLLKIHKKHKLPFPYWLVNDDQYKVGKGMFKVPVDGSTNDAVADEPKSETKSEAAYIVSSLTGNIVPKKDSVFVSFGNYPDLKSIMKSILN